MSTQKRAVPKAKYLICRSRQCSFCAKNLSHAAAAAPIGLFPLHILTYNHALDLRHRVAVFDLHVEFIPFQGLYRQLHALVYRISAGSD